MVLMKIYWGDPREKICEAIDKIPLSCLVIGNRGLGKIKRLNLINICYFILFLVSYCMNVIIIVLVLVNLEIMFSQALHLVPLEFS